MTMFFRWLLLFVYAMLFLTACKSLVQDVDPGRLPKVDKKLVVNSFISPQDSIISVAVGESRPVVGPDTVIRYTIPNATVVLSDGTRSIALGYSQGTASYTANARTFPIRAGQTYRLQVSTPDNRRVEAVCTVPQAIPVATALVDSVATNQIFSSQREMVYYVRMRWQDPTGQTNFYRVAGEVAYTFNLNQGPAYQPLSFGRGNSLMSDRSQDGQIISSSRGELPATPQTPTGSRLGTTVTAYLLHTDKNYYDYHTTVFRQDQTGANPFAEPVLVSSNVEGGLGCFGAYNRSTVTVTLKK